MALGRLYMRPSFFRRRFSSLRLIGSSSRRSATTARSCRSSSSLSYCSKERSTAVFRPFASTTYCSRAAMGTTLPNFSICINPGLNYINSHSLRHANPQGPQRPSQLLPRVIRHCYQHCALYFVFFGDNAVPVIEKIKGPRQIERVLCQKGRLGAGGSLSIRLFQTCGQHQQRPDVVSGLAFEHSRNVLVPIPNQVCSNR